MTREILTVAQMTATDSSAVERGVAITTLMERAGARVAEAVLERYAARPTVVWCGPGDNGGDGYVVARRLAEAGWPVVVEAARPPASEACRGAAERWIGETRPLATELTGGTLYIDALFGAGLSRPLEGDLAALARASQDPRLTSSRSTCRRASTATRGGL